MIDDQRTLAPDPGNVPDGPCFLRFFRRRDQRNVIHLFLRTHRGGDVAQLVGPIDLTTVDSDAVIVLWYSRVPEPSFSSQVVHDESSVVVSRARVVITHRRSGWGVC